MLPSLRRISDRFVSEASAWLGTRENLGFKVISYVKPDTFNLQTGFGAGVTCIMPEGISGKIIEAQQQNRKITTIYVKDPKSSEGIAYVITIDIDRGRVDRKLSSPELLLDPWLKKQYSTHHEYLSPTFYLRSIKLFDVLDAPFLPLGGRPFGNHYEHAFLKRQEEITASFGYSRRFKSLVSCLAPQLDPETCVRFENGMHKLWEHELWMRRRIQFTEAEQVLSGARLEVTLVEVHDCGYFHDETLMEECTWTDADQNVVARGKVCCDWGDQKPSVGIYVFGEYFCREDGDRLLNCFKDKVVKDLRGTKLN